MFLNHSRSISDAFAGEQPLNVPIRGSIAEVLPPGKVVGDELLIEFPSSYFEHEVI
jgi:hypothetical protein